MFQILNRFSAKASVRLFANKVPEITAALHWQDIMAFPAICSSKAQTVKPALNTNSTIPVEHLIPLFACVSISALQNQLMRKYSPALHVLNIDNKITVFTFNSAEKKLPDFMGYVSFRKFSDWENWGKPIGTEDFKNSIFAFAQLSSLAMCKILITCFGLLISKSMGTHQMTFGGEKVVGWAVQIGNVNLEHNDVVRISVVDLKNQSDLSSAVEKVQNKLPLPVGVTTKTFADDPHHAWLTFVTESGRIFDLDLSAFQFGGFPSAVPVLSAERTAFSGIFNREALLGVDSAEGFASAIYEMHCDFVRFSISANGREMSDFAETETSMMEHYMAVVDHIMAFVSTEIPKIAVDKETYFLNFICDTPCSHNDASEQK